jgi:hypothetical protein
MTLRKKNARATFPPVAGDCFVVPPRNDGSHCNKVNRYYSQTPSEIASLALPPEADTRNDGLYVATVMNYHS